DVPRARTLPGTIAGHIGNEPLRTGRPSALPGCPGTGPAAGGGGGGRRAGGHPPDERAADRHDQRGGPQPVPGALEPAGQLRTPLAGRPAAAGSSVRVLVARDLLPADRGLSALPV